MTRAENIIHIISEALNVRPVNMKKNVLGGAVVYSYQEKILGGFFEFKGSVLKYGVGNKQLMLSFQEDDRYHKVKDKTTPQDVKKILKALSIMKSMVLSILKQEPDITHITFQGDAEQPGRIRLYTRFAQEIAKHVGGRAITRPYQGGVTFEVDVKGKPNTRRLQVPAALSYGEDDYDDDYYDDDNYSRLERERDDLYSLPPYTMNDVDDWANELSFALKQKGLDGDVLIRVQPRDGMEVRVKGSLIPGSELERLNNHHIKQFIDLKLQNMAFGVFRSSAIRRNPTHVEYAARMHQDADINHLAGRTGRSVRHGGGAVHTPVRRDRRLSRRFRGM